ncbi:MAG TPA: response regulator [Candidatus Saccharimonadales bacterium]|jgi:CheY-like chemotaxis protein|nr:response regulator [Candidatus Saccharimonadales bacterium]
MDNQPQPPASSPAPGRRVLCIEDERFITELYLRALTKVGYKVDAAADGQEALTMAETNQYDIILLDLMIPTITGIEILRQLRDPRRVPPITAKIIITTNLEQRDDVRADIERQADGYLVKAELTPHELVNFLNTIK